MKKKIKDMTIGEFISLVRKIQESDSDTCSECPLKKVEYLACWEYCSKSKYQSITIDNIINQEIEVEDDEQ